MLLLMSNQEKPTIKNEKKVLFGQFLAERSIISQAQLEQVLKYQETKKIKIGNALVDLGIINEEVLVQNLVAFNKTPRLGEILIAMDVITKEELHKALEAQKKEPNKKLGVHLVELGYIEKSVLVKFLLLQSKGVVSKMESSLLKVNRMLKTKPK